VTVFLLCAFPFSFFFFFFREYQIDIYIEFSMIIAKITMEGS